MGLLYSLRAKTGNGIDLTLRPEMLDLASRGLLFTVYFPFALIPHVIGNLVAGIGTVLAFVIGYRHLPLCPRHQTVRNFTYGIAIVIGAGLVTAYFLPVTILIQMQLLRIGVFLLYSGCSILLISWSVNMRRPTVFSGFLAAWIKFHSADFPSGCHPDRVSSPWFEEDKPKPSLADPFGAGVRSRHTGHFPANEPLVPWFLYIRPESDWRDVQEWAKANTPVNAKFITPPHIFWHYTPDWRVFSERGSIATAPEMMEIPFDPAFESSFRSRFEAVAPGAIDQFNGNYMQTLEITEQAYYTNTTDDFMEIGCQYSADYLVVESEHPYNLDLVYQNQEFSFTRYPIAGRKSCHNSIHAINFEVEILLVRD